MAIGEGYCVPARTPPQSNITALIFVVRSLPGFAALVTSIFSLLSAVQSVDQTKRKLVKRKVREKSRKQEKNIRKSTISPRQP
jgi:uncharacterized membrane protein